MPALLNDNEISQLLSEQKPLPANYREMLVTRPKRGHRERELTVTGNANHEFRIILR